MVSLRRTRAGAVSYLSTQIIYFPESNKYAKLLIRKSYLQMFDVVKV